MSEQVISPVESPLLSPVQRVVNIFVAPSKTFGDIRRSSGWWFPYLLAAVVGLIYAFVVLHRIGVPALVDAAIHQSAKMQDQMANATPEQAARIRSMTAISFNALYAGPVFSIVIGLIVGGILLAAANFGAGGKATFAQMLAVWFYGSLPLLVFFLLTIAAIYAGLAGDSFNIKNPIGTNVGFYLSDAPKALVPLLSAIDLFAIWTAWLLAIGVSIVAGIKRGAAIGIVFGAWFVWVLIQCGLATLG